MTPNFIVFMLCLHIGIPSSLSQRATNTCCYDAQCMGLIDGNGDITDKGHAYIEGLKAVPEPHAIWSCK